jgi:hypothetical protein
MGLPGVRAVRPNPSLKLSPNGVAHWACGAGALPQFCAAVPARHTVGATLARTLGRKATGVVPHAPQSSSFHCAGYQRLRTCRSYLRTASSEAVRIRPIRKSRNMVQKSSSKPWRTAFGGRLSHRESIRSLRSCSALRRPDCASFCSFIFPTIRLLIPWHLGLGKVRVSWSDPNSGLCRTRSRM